MSYYNSSEYKAKKYKEILVRVESEGYSMLSKEWTGFRSYYNIKCPVGHEYPVQWAEFNRGTRCGKCHSASMQVKNPKFKGKSRDEFRNEMTTLFKSELTKEGYQFNPDFEYANNRSLIPVTCSHGHKWRIGWNGWSNGARCRYCFEESVRKTSEQINDELKSHGCELIGQYQGANSPFKYNCSCGGVGSTRIGDFRSGVRCKRCSGEKAKETLRLQRLEKLKKWESEVV